MELSNTLSYIAQIGLCMYLYSLGYEINTKEFWIISLLVVTISLRS